MILKTLRRLSGAIFAVSFVFATQAWSQNAMQTNTRTDNVYDGVTYAQLLALFSDTSFNDAPFTIIEHGTPNGSAYFSLTSPQLPFAIYVTGAEEGFSGEGDGIYAGFALFTTLKLNNFTQSHVNEFNYRSKFVKFSPGQTDGIFSVEQLAAGGITDKAMVSTLIPFFGGLTRLVAMASEAQNTVSYETDSAVTWSQDGYAVRFAEPPLLPSKISTGSFDDLSKERLIRDFAKKTAAGDH